MRGADANDAAVRVRVFGALLTADRTLPGLPVAPPGDDGHCLFWQLRTTDVAYVGHSADASLQGSMVYGDGTRVTLAVSSTASEIVIGDTGRFTLLHDGRIHHHAPPDVDRAAVALDLIGVVLPYAMHRRGAWCLHASAIQFGNDAIAFVAPRGTGKSTLAACCVVGGAPLVADDVVVIAPSDGAISVTPTGLPLRLRGESARAVGVADQVTDGWGKVRVPAADAARSLPLSAVYVLNAAAPDLIVTRARRSTRAAALALLTNGKLTELLGAAEAGDVLSRCVAIAENTPVFDLAVPRDLTRLGEVHDALQRWHSRDGAGAA